ncbi:Glucoside xylosyltransferase 2 [Porphyridium purpureum]|uniref:UDP-D-xylose:beta-D-glucoside alpha-1,3-D-xylosyltransferase n=1 Tax=Porphyridium purpureum TaxID=35688 RepID=A0A5J4Z6G7_PORPP|nr:Glucoside xylosyltransferase 2 [Porphyridium purpureum]|eukprot:POR4276..scf295_1
MNATRREADKAQAALGRMLRQPRVLLAVVAAGVMFTLSMIMLAASMGGAGPRGAQSQGDVAREKTGAPLLGNIFSFGADVRVMKQHVAVQPIAGAQDASRGVAWRRKQIPAAKQVDLALAVCSSGVWNLAEAVLKSMFLFAATDRHYVLYMFVIDGDVAKTADHFEAVIEEFLDEKPLLSFELQVLPASSDKETNFFKVCSGQRLYIPDALPHVDRLLYLDADILFLDDVSKMWDMFDQWTPNMLFGLSPEKSDEVPTNLQYCNAGIAMMNLKGLRSFGLLAYAKDLYTRKVPLPFFDQDIFNRICAESDPAWSRCFHLPCSWNFRTDYIFTPGCSHSSRPGGKISLIHGNRVLFLREEATGPLQHRTRAFSSLAKKLWEALAACRPLSSCAGKMLSTAEEHVRNEREPCEFKSPYFPDLDAKPTTGWTIPKPADGNVLWKYANGTCVNSRLALQLKEAVDASRAKLEKS